VASNAGSKPGAGWTLNPANHHSVSTDKLQKKAYEHSRRKIAVSASKSDFFVPLTGTRQEVHLISINGTIQLERQEKLLNMCKSKSYHTQKTKNLIVIKIV
jgi:hypothetical protein